MKTGAASWKVGGKSGSVMDRCVVEAVMRRNDEISVKQFECEQT